MAAEVRSKRAIMARKRTKSSVDTASATHAAGARRPLGTNITRSAPTAGRKVRTLSQGNPFTTSLSLEDEEADQRDGADAHEKRVVLRDPRLDPAQRFPRVRQPPPHA